MRLFGTLFFTCRRNGWSETYPIDAGDYSTGLTKLEGVRDLRKTLLVNDASIIGARLSDTDTKGDSYPLGWTFPIVGTYATTPTDETGNMDLAIRVKFFSGAVKRGNRWIHAIPTSQIAAGGGLVPAGTWGAKLDAWAAYVEANISLASKIGGAVAPPYYTFYAIDDSDIDLTLVSRAIGRPFGLRRGRRAVA